ncbi:CLUMA_CG015237, isoform A [Clunio marinus]|uniref:CLUMA_CG015237, isoform A n=1 Tax=Clunio marinus TaxID=568069 RepID=A0A1J1INT2_9DIPT|nr:CLUMA_CG015237, isoform A [Clunio marinus]
MTSLKSALKVSIVVLGLIRLIHTISHLISYYDAHKRVLSGEMALSFAVGCCSLMLMLGVFGECQIILEVWMVSAIIMYGAMGFYVYDLIFENDTFFSRNRPTNIAISLILQLITLILVMKLHKVITVEDDELHLEDEENLPRNQTNENNENAAVCSFEPYLFHFAIHP